MSCRQCLELEQFLQSAMEPDLPNMLSGLNEKALRNRLQQREEKIDKQRMLLMKHQKACSGVDRPVS